MYTRLKGIQAQKHGGKKAGDVFMKNTTDCFKWGEWSMIQGSLRGKWKDNFEEV